MSKQYAIGEVYKITVTREDANFDRACDAAMNLALREFGVDGEGRLLAVTGYCRTTDCVVVHFKEFVMDAGHLGCGCGYLFDAYVERSQGN